MEFTRADLNVLFWVVGCTTGASVEEIVEHEARRHRHPPTADAIRESLARLKAEGVIVLQGDRYQGEAGLQRAFLHQCRNCRDTIEEVEILRRLLRSSGRPDDDG
jgi:hypothetical protein